MGWRLISVDLFSCNAIIYDKKGGLMSLLKFNYSSRVLETDTEVNLILPEPFPQSEDGEKILKRELPDEGFPTLYLLHGLTENQTAWIRKSSIERYAAAHDLAAVIPNAEASFYTDMARGKNYWTFLSKELPEVCRRYFPLSDRREDNFVAGLSMGGYGAFKWALREPKFFAAAASLSGALDMAGIVEEVEDPEELKKLEWVFGDLEELRESENDLLHLARSLDGSDEPKPNLFQCCGTDDFLYEANLSFKRTVDKLSLDLTYSEEAGASHEWEYWDRMIREVLDWFPLN